MFSLLRINYYCQFLAILCTFIRAVSGTHMYVVQILLSWHISGVYEKLFLFS